MFEIDTGGSTSAQGPFLSWSSNGSAEKGFPPRSWVLRDKDDRGERTETVVPAFETGCVLDLDTLQIGWERDGGKGMAPERRWNPSVAQATPRPDESRKPSGGYSWSRALSVRVAIGGGRAATWEQGSFGAYEAFSRLAKAISAQHPGDNTLPLVKQTSIEKRDLPNGAANIPVLEIVKWVPRPACLKADAPKIDTGADEFDAPAPRAASAPARAAAKPAPAPVPVPATADDLEF
jgi:hypothetical protein